MVGYPDAMASVKRCKISGIFVAALIPALLSVAEVKSQPAPLAAVDALFSEIDPKLAGLRGVAAFEEAVRNACPVVTTPVSERCIATMLRAGLYAVQAGGEGREQGYRWGKEALAMAVRDYAGQALGVAAYTEFATISSQSGRQKEAKSAYGMALAGLDKLGVGDSAGRATILGSLGGTLVELQEFQEAEKQLLASIAMYRSLYPEGHENLAGALSAMGDLSRTLSKARESDQYSREAAEMIRRLPQAKPDLRGTVFLNRGNALSTLGRFEEAREVLGEASAAYRVGPGTAPGEAFVANALAVMSIAEGRYEEADQALQEVVRVRIALFGEPDKRVAVVRNNLASVKRMRGALVEAEDLFAQAANTIRSIGNKDPDLIPVLGSLGGLRREKMDYEGAEAAFDEAMRVAEALPRPTRELAILLHNKGVLEHERGRLPQAKELFEKSLALKRNILPAGNTGILQDEYALALLLRDMGEEEKAEQKFKECLAGFEKGPNGMPREQSLTLNQLANLARAKGHFADAEKHLKKAISVSTASMGPRNPNLASLKKDLGTLLRLQGKAGEATLP